MVSFSIHFLFCNIFVSLIIGTLLLVKRLGKKHLSGHGQYQLWFLLPVVLWIPFLPLRPTGFSRLIDGLGSAGKHILPTTAHTGPSGAAGSLSPSDWLNDFGVSVTRASGLRGIPLAVWMCGMLAMTVFLLKSRIHLLRLERSALPVQCQQVKLLYGKCLKEMKIRHRIPLYSTAFLQSPVILGVLRPRIYIPIHLISDCREMDMRYMLLHELQHYKHRDALIGCLMNLSAIVYWFNPVVWYALKEFRTDREIACDTAVLEMLEKDDYIDYGNTLLNFARKLSRSPFFLETGIGGNAGQIRKRIENIALYRPLSRQLKMKERILLAALAALILESTTLIPVMASDAKASLPSNALIRTEDLSDCFDGQEGCFVLYDMGTDTWDIYNESLALTRFSPDSTYKLYSALLALENQTITPAASTLKWDGQTYPFPEWNRDQDLASALQSSVNWYFQALDKRAGMDALQEFFRDIDYGNHDLSGGLSEFWMESSLKISALEQVTLLKKLYRNDFHFGHENVQAVKDSLALRTSGGAVLCGKTGSGIVNGKSVNGWFIGWVESEDNTWLFAANVQGADQADGVRAGEITLGILARKQIYG